MKIVLAPVGTRGDVQPMLALAAALQSRGHRVTICAPSNFEQWIKDLGFSFASCKIDFESLMRNERNGMLRKLSQQMDNQFSTLLECSQDADAIIGGMLQFAGPSIAELKKIPYFYSAITPVLLKSHQHPCMLIRHHNLPSLLNKLSFVIFEALCNQLFRKSINKERIELGLAPVKDVYRYQIYSDNIILFAELAIAPPLSVNGSFFRTGFWFWEETGQLDRSLVKFLSAGRPPIYIGFGSMISKEATNLTRLLIEALEIAGERGVISSGWAGLEGKENTNTTHFIGSVPHPILFPKVAAVVHHGGAGTTATALRSGVPQIIVPFMADQFYWGDRINKTGLGPKPIPLTALSTKNLARAIKQAVSDAEMKKRVQVVSQQVCVDGVEQAVQFIETVIGQRKEALKK